MDFNLSDKIWLFNINVDLVMVILLTVVNAILLYVYVNEYKVINKSIKGFYVFLIPALLMWSLFMGIFNFGFNHYVGTSTLQNMPKKEKQLAKAMIDRTHQPINLFQWNSVDRDYDSTMERIKQKEVDKNNMRDPEVLKQLKEL